MKSFSRFVARTSLVGDSCVAFSVLFCLLIATPSLTFARLSEIEKEISIKTRADAPQTQTQFMIHNLPFAAGEQLIYDVEFSRALLRGVNIAEFRFSANKRLPVKTSQGGEINNLASGEIDNEEYDFACEATSKGWFQKLFNLSFRFSIKSFVEIKNFAVARTVKIDEQGKRLRESEAVYDRTANLLTWTERSPLEPQNQTRVLQTPLSDSTQKSGAALTQDMVSIFYYLRTRTDLKPGLKLEVPLTDNGQIFRIPVSIARRTRTHSVIGEADALELKVDVFGAGKLVETDGSMTLWLTDDARHLPLKARISTHAGTVDVKLKKFISRS